MTPPPGAAGPWPAAEAGAARLAALSGADRHDVAVVLGSGWSPVADALSAGDPAPPSGPGLLPGPVLEWPASELGGPGTGVAGHAGVVRSVERHGGRVLVFVGRVHPYEGHDLDAVVHPVRLAAAAGCRAVVLTNAAGGIDPSYRVGQAVLISDHLNLTGRSPLAGPPPPPPWAGRFVDLTDLYTASLRRRLLAQVTLAEGVYAGLPGPHYETPAEIRMLAGMGADLVGMSTVHEAIAARHAGLGVVGVSLVTNAAAGVTGEVLAHADVVAAGAAASAAMAAVLAAAVDVALASPPLPPAA